MWAHSLLPRPLHGQHLELLNLFPYLLCPLLVAIQTLHVRTPWPPPLSPGKASTLANRAKWDHSLGLCTRK